MVLTPPFAGLTVRDTVRESLLSEVLKAGVITRKLAVEIFDCVPKVSGNRLSAVHDVQTLAETGREVKG
jgi:hypothetical protein